MSAGTKRFYCGHCKEYVCKTTYHQHKRLYFDKENKRWSSEQVFAVASASTQAAFIPTSMKPKERTVPENDAEISEAACDYNEPQLSFG